MILENLETEQLVRIANIWAIDKWEKTYPENKWNGFDLVGKNCIFQLSYEGMIRIWEWENLTPINLNYDQEDSIRKVLNHILRNGK